MAVTAPNGELWVTDAKNGKVVFYSTTADKILEEVTTTAGARAIAFSMDDITSMFRTRVLPQSALSTSSATPLGRPST